MLLRGVTNHWTGLLDWTTGLEHDWTTDLDLHILKLFLLSLVSYGLQKILATTKMINVRNSQSKQTLTSSDLTNTYYALQYIHSLSINQSINQSICCRECTSEG